MFCKMYTLICPVQKPIKAFGTYSTNRSYKILYEPKVEYHVIIYAPMLSFVLQRSRIQVRAINLFITVTKCYLGADSGREETFTIFPNLIETYVILYAPILS